MKNNKFLLKINHLTQLKFIYFILYYKYFFYFLHYKYLFYKIFTDRALLISGWKGRPST